MMPALRAAELRRAAGGNFLEELEAHLLRGYVFSTERLFLMGRAMPRAADPSDLWCEWPEADCDAWYVWLAVGELRDLVALMPRPLPWIGWHRQGREWRESHWIATGTLRRRLK